jgi:hypothetical protein
VAHEQRVSVLSLLDIHILRVARALARVVLRQRTEKLEDAQSLFLRWQLNLRARESVRVDGVWTQVLVPRTPPFCRVLSVSRGISRSATTALYSRLNYAGTVDQKRARARAQAHGVSIHPSIPLCP